METRLQRTASASNRSQDNFKQLAEFSGSQKEREAHRKNRVIQMRLGVCLSEITLQQRSSALIHRMEEARFLQKAKTRPTQPRSAKMLAQLRSCQPHINTPPSKSWPLRHRCVTNTALCATNTAPCDKNTAPCATNTANVPLRQRHVSQSHHFCYQNSHFYTTSPWYLYHNTQQKANPKPWNSPSCR